MPVTGSQIASTARRRRFTRSQTRAPRRNAMRHQAGLSLMELLVSLAIVAALLTATMVAIDASFRAYAAAAESASTQTTTRLATHRLLMLIRTSTAHGPLQPDSDNNVELVNLNTLKSPYIEVIDPKGNHVRLEYRADKDELWVITTPYGQSTANAQPLLGGVTAATFHLHRRLDDDGVWVLERASATITVQPDDDATLDVEDGNAPPINLVASTMPRKLR